MTRQIVWDTETTGLNPEDKPGDSTHKPDKIIEIAAIEIVDYLPTGRTFHTLINPERDIPQDATEVHGIRDEDVFSAPVFVEQYEAFMAFIGDSDLIAHNASFDMQFINAELKHIGQPPLTNTVIDTLRLAREKFPNSPASLDALCRRFNISLEGRDKHNALLDTQLLSKVYLQLMGGAQHRIRIDSAGPGQTQYEARPFHRTQGMTLPLYTGPEAWREQHTVYMDKKVRK